MNSFSRRTPDRSESLYDSGQFLFGFDLVRQQRHALVQEQLQAHLCYPECRQGVGRQVIPEHHAKFMDSPITSNRADEAPIHGWSTCPPDTEALLIRQPFQGMSYLGWLDIPGAAHSTQIAGETVPHRGAGQNFIPHSSTDQSNNLSRWVLHLAGSGTGAGANPALDTTAYLLTARYGCHFIYKAHNGKTHISMNLPTGQTRYLKKPKAKAYNSSGLGYAGGDQ